MPVARMTIWQMLLGRPAGTRHYGLTLNDTPFCG